MTEQEIFNTAWDWFITQNKPRSVSRTMCLYRGPDGARCVAGLFIPDERYRGSLEGRNLYDQEVAECLSEDAMPHRAFIRDLQHIHDDVAEGPHIARELFVEFAQKHQLEVPNG